MSNAYARAVREHADVESRALAKAQFDMGLEPLSPSRMWHSPSPSRIWNNSPLFSRSGANTSTGADNGSGSSFSFHHGDLTGPPLDPQPSVRPEDPLNWSWRKKHAVLFALIPGSLLSDWTLTWGTTVFQLQASEWNMAVEEVAQSVSPGIFMQGTGGILAVPLCQRYGRLPVLFWSQLLCLVCTIGAIHARSYTSFTAMRTLQGFFGAAPQVIGLSVVHDMFFFQERTRKINIWAASFLIGPYLGPFISSLLLLRLDWRDNFAVLAGFYGLSVAMVAFLGDETLFDRDGHDLLRAGLKVCGRPQPVSPGRRVALLLGVEGYRNRAARPGLWTVFRHQCSLLGRPYLLLPTALFITPMTMWTIGLVTTMPQFVLPATDEGGYGFSYVGLSMFYWAPMLGTLAAELWGHWFNDALAARHMPRFGPESRLTAVYPGVAAAVAGLVLFGATMQHRLHWAGLAFGWAMVCFGTLSCTTAVSAYALDCLPRHAASASAWINCWRVVGGFSVVYFQGAWVRSAGAGAAFGGQAAVIAAAAMAVVVAQVWGRSWRERYPAPAEEN